MAIVMRMAGLSWYEAIRLGRGDQGEIAAVFNGVDAINFLSEASRALVAERAAEARHAARAAGEPRRRHRRRRARHAAHLGGTEPRRRASGC